jgi:predicted kinase
MSSKLYIIRGLPGSGKSTFAKSLDVPHYEADMYFMNENGEYNFDRNLLGIAHGWCFKNVKAKMMRGMDVVVSNTFTRRFEFDNYIQEAKKHGVEIVVYRMTAQYQNTHDVPEDVIQIMKNRFEDYDGEILV